MTNQEKAKDIIFYMMRNNPEVQNTEIINIIETTLGLKWEQASQIYFGALEKIVRKFINKDDTTN